MLKYDFNLNKIIMENIELKDIVDLLNETWVKQITFNWKVIIDLENIENLEIWENLEYKKFDVEEVNEKQMAIFTFIKK